MRAREQSGRTDGPSAHSSAGSSDLNMDTKQLIEQIDRIVKKTQPANVVDVKGDVHAACA